MSEYNKMVKFPKSLSSDYYIQVKKRVNAYFKDHALSPHANWKMILKSVVLFSIYIATYTLLITDNFGPVGVLTSFAILGLMIALLGFNLTHDALHGSYTGNHTLDRVIGFVFDLNGTSSYVWKITHNLKHHTYTNVHGVDEDIDKMVLFRFSPSDGSYWFHRYQHIYAPVLYSFLAVKWIYYVDYPVIFQEIREGKLSFKEGVIFFGFKAANLLMFVIAPFVFLSVSWWITLLGILLMHAVTSISLTFVFQLAHIVENVEHPQPNEEGLMEDDWALHEMKTTSNFANTSALITQLVGGLNFQVEHHLFPRICHIHYPEISKIVKQTAQEFNMPYYEQSTFFGAIASHLRTLRKLGRLEM